MQIPMMVALSPMGAARAYGLRVIAELQKKLGTEQVKVFDFGKWEGLIAGVLAAGQEDYVPDFLGQAFLTQVVAHKVKALLVLPLCPLNAYYLRLVRGLGVRAVHWFYEDWRVAQYWRDIAGEYDLFLGVQKGSLPSMVASRGGSYGYLPLGLAEGCGGGVAPSERPYDFVFVGVASSYRIAILNALASYGYVVLVAGESWGEGLVGVQRWDDGKNWLPESEAWSLYKKSKFGLCLSVEDPVCNNGLCEQQISPRAYELAACGCLPIFEKLELNEDVFKSLYYMEFTNVNELVVSLRSVDYATWSAGGWQSNAFRAREKFAMSNQIDLLIECM